MWQYRWFRLSTYVAVLAWTSVIASLGLVVLGALEFTGRGRWAQAALWVIAIVASLIRDSSPKPR